MQGRERKGYDIATTLSMKLRTVGVEERFLQTESNPKIVQSTARGNHSWASPCVVLGGYETAEASVVGVRGRGSRANVTAVEATTDDLRWFGTGVRFDRLLPRSTRAEWRQA